VAAANLYVDTTIMNILVLWADHSSPNLGIQALAHGTEAIVKRVWPEAKVDVEVHTPGPWPRFVPAASFTRAWLGGDLRERRRLAHYDLVVDTGSGDSFADIYGLRRLLQMSSTRASAARAGANVVMGPQTIGPFRTRSGRIVARLSLRGVSQVIARDTESAEYCRSTLRWQPTLATDVVFAMARPDVASTRGVIVNVSGLLWSPNPHVDHLKYRRATVAFVARLLDAGIPVSLLAHVVFDGIGDADNYAVAEAAAAVGGDIEQLMPRDVIEARELIASARLVVGARMHACLNSLSVGVPALPWAYSRKFAPLARDLAWPHVIDLRTASDIAERSWSIAGELLDDGANEQLALVRARADERLDLAADAIRRLHA
jgi:polysaccharide pyruvyl transferase WcaK-like protein